MNTGEVCCRLLGGVTLTGACGLCDAAIHDQVVTIVHQHMSPIAQLRWMGIGLTGKQGLGIRAGAVGAVAELDATKVALDSFLPFFGSTESLTTA